VWFAVCASPLAFPTSRGVTNQDTRGFWIWAECLLFFIGRHTSRVAESRLSAGGKFNSDIIFVLLLWSVWTSSLVYCGTKTQTGKYHEIYRKKVRQPHLSKAISKHCIAGGWGSNPHSLWFFVTVELNRTNWDYHSGVYEYYCLKVYDTV